MNLHRLKHKMFGDRTFYKETILIALPIIVQQLISGIVTLTDNIMVGQLGEEAASGVSVANKYMFIITLTVFGLMTGASIYISQYFGANDKYKCRDLFRISVVTSTIVGFVIVLPMAIMPEQILRAFGLVDPVSIELGASYGRIVALMFVPFAISSSITSSLRAIGRNVEPMLIGMLAVFTNTFFNYVFIYGVLGFPQMGAAGAAVGTLISRLIETVLLVLLIASKKYVFRWELKKLFMIDSDLLKKVVKKSLPMMANELLWAVGITFIFMSYARTDTKIIPVLSAVDVVSNFVFIIFAAMSAATSILIGKRLGANQIDEAKENATRLIVLATMVAMSLAFIIFLIAPFVPLLYNYSDKTNEAIVQVLRIKSFFYPIYAITGSMFFIIRAGGDTTSTLIMDAVFTWVGPVLLSTIISLNGWLPIIPLYILIESMDFIKIGISAYFLKKGNWAKNITEKVDVLE